MLIDIHCHLDYPDFKDIDAVIQRAKDAGLSAVITNGIDVRSNRAVLEMAGKYPIVKAALGIYPPWVLKKEYEQLGMQWQEFDNDDEIEFIRKHKPIAIGEIGMDFKEDIEREEQKKLFVKMIRLAKELDKPVIVHSRKAEKEVIEILEAEKAKKVILHCFSGNKKLVERAIKNGWYLTAPTHIVRSEQFQHHVKAVDINHLFCETDAPFLTPFQGKRNEPAFVVEAYKKVAEIKGMTMEEVEKNIFMNYKRVFE